MYSEYHGQDLDPGPLITDSVPFQFDLETSTLVSGLWPPLAAVCAGASSRDDK